MLYSSKSGVRIEKWQFRTKKDLMWIKMHFLRVKNEINGLWLLIL